MPLSENRRHGVLERLIIQASRRKSVGFRLCRGRMILPGRFLRILDNRAGCKSWRMRFMPAVQHFMACGGLRNEVFRHKTASARWRDSLLIRTPCSHGAGRRGGVRERLKDNCYYICTRGFCRDGAIFIHNYKPESFSGDSHAVFKPSLRCGAGEVVIIYINLKFYASKQPEKTGSGAGQQKKIGAPPRPEYVRNGFIY